MCTANLDWLEFGRITDKQSLIKYWIQSKWKKIVKNKTCNNSPSNHYRRKNRIIFFKYLNQCNEWMNKNRDSRALGNVCMYVCVTYRWWEQEKKEMSFENFWMKHGYYDYYDGGGGGGRFFSPISQLFHRNSFYSLFSIDRNKTNGKKKILTNKFPGWN